MRHEIRIVPHKYRFIDGGTWYWVQAKTTIFRINRFRIWYWRTVGDYSSLGDAVLCRDNVRTCYKMNEAESEGNND